MALRILRWLRSVAGSRRTPALLLAAAVLAAAGCQEYSYPTPGLGSGGITSGFNGSASFGPDESIPKHGEYFSTMLESVEFRLMQAMGSVYTSGGTLTVAFVLRRDGSVSDVHAVSPDPALSGAVIDACIRSIQDGAPYSKWSAPMLLDMGAEHTVPIRFVLK